MTTERFTAPTSVDVVVVGGGPVGMLAAAEIALGGVSVVVIESRTSVDTRPRAGTVHARSLSLLARRGYLPAVPAADLADRADAVRRAPFQFAAQPILSITAPATETAPIAGIPQASLEAAFEARARESGATVLRGHTALALEQTATEVRLRYADPAGTEHELVAAYAVGADGARSLVAASGDFPETTYPATMHAIAALASAPDANTPPPGWHQADGGWTLHNPNPGGPARIIAMDFSGPRHNREIPTEREYFDALRAVLGEAPQLREVHGLTRFSDFGRYRERLCDGRLLLAGDAAHVHYPLGGQGLNTGMQDAFALGWRLARVVTRADNPTVLEDYSRERVTVAAVVVGNTVLQSRMMAPDGTDLRDAVAAMLTVPQVHDALAEVISGQFQQRFQTDLAVHGARGTLRSLTELLAAGRHVALRPDEHTPFPPLPSGTVTATGKLTPEPAWTSAVIRPDGYLADVL
ncbi:FAD-dependent monooxygenase [Gordonia sinesedis]